MSVTLKSIVHARRMSEETNAFTATVCWNGKPVGTAKNHGTGGSTDVYINRHYGPPLPPLLPVMEAWAKSQPPVEVEGFDPLPMNLELYIDGLVEDDLRRKDNQRLCRGHLVWKLTNQREGDFCSVKVTPENLDKARAYAVTKYGEQIDYFLNDRIGGTR
jgi:hypothetical protein